VKRLRRRLVNLPPDNNKFVRAICQIVPTIKKRIQWLLRVEKNFAGSGSKKGYVKSYKGHLTGLA
jgi:hypothetical protein